MTDHLVVSLDRLPSLLAAFVLLGLAALLLRIDFETRLHRAFAFLLVLKAFFLGLISFTADSPLDMASRLRMYFAIAIPFAAVYFALVFHAHYAPSRRPRATVRMIWLAGLALVSVGLLLLYAFNKDLYYDGAGSGPLSLFVPGSYLAFAAIALMFGRLALAQEAPNRRSALMLGAVALSLEPLHQSTMILLANMISFGLGNNPFQGVLERPEVAAYWMIWLATFATLTGAGVMFFVRGRRDEGHLRRDARRSLLVMLLPMLTGALSVLLDRMAGSRIFLNFHWGLDAVWVLVAACLIAYAVIHHRFLDSPRRLGRTVRTSTVVGVLILVFFLAKELLEEILVEQYPLLTGIGAAVVAVALLHPVVLFVGRWLRKVMPSVTSGVDLDKDQRVALYRSQVEVVWMDGVVTRKERLLLDRMAERLQLSTAQTQQIENEVVSAIVEDGPGDARVGDPAASS